MIPKIMGILNVTPDSFSDGGDFLDVERAVARAREMVAEGADIIDIGGESTRPGADTVGQTQELARVLPVIKALNGLNAEISIDTRRPETAKAAVEAGACIWNDVTALTYKSTSVAMAAKLGCKVVLMHMKGNPKSMQKNPHYDDVVSEVGGFLKDRMQAAVDGGVKPENIILDPGIGFGKRLQDNLDLLGHLDDFHALGCPILIGTSRKSFIGKIDGSKPGNRLAGSLASALWAANKGASILRVHDVKETVQAVNVWQAIGERKEMSKSGKIASISINSTKNFTELANDKRSRMWELEKKALTFLSVSSGGAMAAIIAASGQYDKSNEFLLSMLPSLWGFAICLVLSGLNFFVSALSFDLRANQFVDLGNSQSAEQEFAKVNKLLTGFDNADLEKSKVSKKLGNKIAGFQKSARQSEIWADRFDNLNRALYLLSFMAFVFGIGLPLLKLTLIGSIDG